MASVISKHSSRNKKEKECGKSKKCGGGEERNHWNCLCLGLFIYSAALLALRPAGFRSFFVSFLWPPPRFLSVWLSSRKTKEMAIYYICWYRLLERQISQLLNNGTTTTTKTTTSFMRISSLHRNVPKDNLVFVYSPEIKPGSHSITATRNNSAKLRILFGFYRKLYNIKRMCVNNKNCSGVQYEKKKRKPQIVPIP